VQVIVELAPPPAARRGYSADTLHRPAVRAALATIDEAQRALEARIQRLAGASVRWRYRIVLDGLAVVLPADRLAELAALPGVVRVYPTVRYHAALDDTPAVIGAPAVWGPQLDTAGRGIKIGVIDDGIDQAHRFFAPGGYEYPAGFPKGNRKFTTAKVVVARAFPPPGATWRYAGRPFDPQLSFHGMHVAGIAAGNADTSVRGTAVSGVAPHAYLGNYKVLTTPTDGGFGLNGNSPEIVAAIEAAVADGMDVINLSLGEPEVDPGRDAVARALDNAAAAGVVPVVAAGNEFLELGNGSVGSPGTSERAITVAASDGGDIAPFSAAGPTPQGLAMKPDVAAPGVDVLSASPEGGFDLLSGTSMATPHVAGAAALLLELHPAWTPEQVKSALVLSGSDLGAQSTRQGGGRVFLPAAAKVPVFAFPQSLGFGLIDAGSGAQERAASIELVDAGSGAGQWAVTVDAQGPQRGAVVSVPPSVVVPGSLSVQASVSAAAVEGERTGFVVLERAGTRLRLPYWFRVTRPALPEVPVRDLSTPGLHRGNTAGRPAEVDSYRYPDAPTLATRALSGPEQAFLFLLERPVANFGVAVVSTGRGVDVEPRIVRGADENRLLGPPALPYVVNPYLASIFRRVRAAAALLPAPGDYTIVFDTPRGGKPGAFSFRFWIDDVSPPVAELVSRTARGGRILARLRDTGSGIDPHEIAFSIDGGPMTAGRWDARRNLAILDVSGAGRGAHRLRLQVSDRQESKNNENLPRILPNTRVLVATIRVP
jgi:subtilisin family serine protease